MIRTARTRAEAAAIAAEFRAILARTDWVVTITAPLFPGDFYTVTVG